MRWNQWMYAQRKNNVNPYARNPCYIWLPSTFPSLHLCHSSFSNCSVALPMSQLIIQPFHCFTYITAHSPTLLSLLLCHRLFTYAIWRAAHAAECLHGAQCNSNVLVLCACSFLFAVIFLHSVNVKCVRVNRQSACDLILIQYSERTIKM